LAVFQQPDAFREVLGLPTLFETPDGCHTGTHNVVGQAGVVGRRVGNDLLQARHRAVH